MSDSRSSTQFMPPREAALQSGIRSLGVTAAVAFGLLVLATTITTTVVLSQFRSLDSDRQEITYSRQLLDSLAKIRDRIQEPISALGLYGHGGAAPTNYESFRAAIPGALAELRDLATKPADRHNEELLEHEFRDALSSTDRLIERIHSQGAAITESDPDFDRAMIRLAILRRHVNQWRDQHIDNIANSNQSTMQALTRARWMSLTRIGFATTLIAILISIALRTMRRREQLTRELQQSSQLWHGILSNLDQGVGVYSMNNRLMFWNERFLELHGIRKDDLHPGMTLEQVMHLSTNLSHANIQMVIRESADVVAAMQRGESTTITHVTESGTALQGTARPMAADYYVVTLTDVTALHRSEAAAVENATRLTTIMDNVPDAIITLNESGRVESWSAGAERMFGFTSWEMRQHSLERLMAAPRYDRQDDCLKQLLAGLGTDKAGQRCEFTARHRDGRLFPIDLMVSEMRIAGRRLFVGIVRDITERRAVDQMKREFIATVSHELRTPLTSISGSLGLLNTNPHNDLSAVTQRLVNIAHKNSERLTRLINDILDLEKGEAGRLRLQLKPLSLYAAVEQAIEANRAYAAAYQVTYLLQGADPRRQVLADADRIMQVLTNLMSNAAKFSPPGTKVLINVHAVDDAVKVAVRDQGPGIPDGFHERVFSRFSQADGSDARPNEGSGLGLAISKSLIEHHGGIIDFDTSPQGTTFWFELPIHDPVEADDDPTTAPDRYVLVDAPTGNSRDS